MNRQSVDATDLNLARDGARLYRAVVNDNDLAGIDAALAHQPSQRAGLRLSGISALNAFLEPETPIGVLAAAELGPKARPVRAILFDKTADTNWALGWHQDRTISVQERLDAPGYGPWTMKAGLLHVAPPFEVLADMITIRVHLDAVTAENGPLRIAIGSHLLGRIPEAAVPDTVQRCGTAVCLADPGDVWVYRTPILHASDAALSPTHRRVLQIDFAARDLPSGLKWSGI